MCLELRYGEERFTPYNKSVIRWKIVEHKGPGVYAPPFETSSRYHSTKWNRAKLNGIPTEEGFHVLVTRADARRTLRGLWRTRGRIVKRIEVKGFLRSGNWSDSPRPRNETWKYFRFVD